MTTQGAKAMQKPQLVARRDAAETDTAAPTGEGIDAAMDDVAERLEATLAALADQPPQPAAAEPSTARPDYFRISNARAWTDNMLADLVPAEEALQTELAAADVAFDNKVATARDDRDRIKAKLAAELKQVSALRAATAIFRGELVKAELPGNGLHEANGAA